jgi:hypothetical protein
MCTPEDDWKSIGETYPERNETIFTFTGELENLEEGMNKTIKILVVLLGGLLALCLLLSIAGWLAYRNVGRVLSQTIDPDRAQVTTVSDGIAFYTLPSNFGEGQAVQLPSLSMVTFTAVDGRTHIYLMQTSKSLPIDRAELEQQMSLASGTDQWNELTVIERNPCQIRGKDATLVISEGVGHEGTLYRSASAVFDGNGGTALVNVSGPTANWDQAMVDSFIESLQ